MCRQLASVTSLSMARGNVLTWRFIALFAPRSSSSELVLNIGGGARVGLKQVIGTIEEILGKKLPIEFRSREAGDARHTGADISRAKAAIGYAPTVALRDGLAAEVAWLQSVLG